MADKLGILPHHLEAVTNHISGHKGGVAVVYNQAEYIEAKRAALIAWSRHIAKIAKG